MTDTSVRPDLSERPAPRRDARRHRLRRLDPRAARGVRRPTPTTGTSAPGCSAQNDRGPGVGDPARSRRALARPPARPRLLLDGGQRRPQPPAHRATAPPARCRTPRARPGTSHFGRASTCCTTSRTSATASWSSPPSSTSTAPTPRCPCPTGHGRDRPAARRGRDRRPRPLAPGGAVRPPAGGALRRDARPRTASCTWARSRCRSPTRAMSDVSAIRADMAASGLGVRVLSAPPFAFPVAGGATDYVDAFNEALGEVVADSAGALVGLGTVVLDDPGTARAQLDGARRDARASPGSRSRRWSAGASLDRGALRQMLADAAELDLAVLVHPMQLPRPEWADHYLANLSATRSRPRPRSPLFCSAGSARSSRLLRICFVHGGGCAPGLLGRWDHGWHTPRRRPAELDTAAEREVRGAVLRHRHPRPRGAAPARRPRRQGPHRLRQRLPVRHGPAATRSGSPRRPRALTADDDHRERRRALPRRLTHRNESLIR